MRDQAALQTYLDRARIGDAVVLLRPDYRALLLAVDGIQPGPSDPGTDQLLAQAEAVAYEALAARSVDDLPHVAAWREAYRAFGAKPQRTRNSLEALLRRAATGLPRVNRLTDIYNAMSVLHQVPLGGEDLDRYTGHPRLARHRQGILRHDVGRRNGCRAPRRRRGHLVRRRGRHLPPLELATGQAHAAHRHHDRRTLHPRRPRTAVRRRAPRRRR